MNHQVLFLSDHDVRAMIEMPAVIAAIEADFKRQADPGSMIVGVPLAYETDDRKLGFRWRLKTAIIRDLAIAGARMTGYKIDATGNGSGGERSATRYLILSDPATSSPLAIIDEHSSFGMRTGAAVCVAAKYLARPDAAVVGLIGVGNVGRSALAGLRELFPLVEVRVMSQRPASRAAFAREQNAVLGLPIRAVDSYEEACRGADIIMSGTPSNAPFIRFEWLKQGTFVGLMGLDEACHDVYAGCDQLFVDYDPHTEPHPAHIRNAFAVGAIPPDKPIRQIWEVVAGKLPGRRDAAERIVVATVGLTTQDIALGYTLYRKARDRGLGIKLPF